MILRLLHETVGRKHDKGLEVSTSRVTWPMGLDAKACQHELLHRLRTRVSLRFIDVGEGVMVNFFTEEDLWATAEQPSSPYLPTLNSRSRRKDHKTMMNQLNRGTLKIEGFQRVWSSQAFQRVSSCPETPPQASRFLGHDEEKSWHQDSSAEEESEAEEGDVDGTFAQALSPSGSRALYWMVVLCKRAGGTPTQTHQNFVNSPSNEGSKERVSGEGLGGCGEVTRGLFRPFGIGPSPDWLREEVETCIHDASRAILLNQIHETRRFDNRLLPISTKETSKVAEVAASVLDRGGGIEGAGLKGMSRSNSRNSVTHSDYSDHGLPDVEFDIEKDREREREKERQKRREKDRIKCDYDTGKGGGASVGDQEGPREQLYCNVVHEIAVTVHERVPPDEALQALRTKILQPHALLDRPNIYLYQETNSNVFFMLASIEASIQKAAIQVDAIPVDAIQVDAIQVHVHPVHKHPVAVDAQHATDACTAEPSVTRGHLNTSASSSYPTPSNSIPIGSTWGVPTRPARIVFQVYGITEPSPELTVQFAGVLQSNVDDMVQRRIAMVLMRHRHLKLSPSDVRVIAPASAPPNRHGTIYIPKELVTKVLPLYIERVLHKLMAPLRVKGAGGEVGGLRNTSPVTAPVFSSWLHTNHIVDTAMHNVDIQTPTNSLGGGEGRGGEGSLGRPLSRLELVYGRQDEETVAPIRSERGARHPAFPGGGSRFSKGGGAPPQMKTALDGSTAGGVTSVPVLPTKVPTKVALGNGLAMVQLTLTPSFVTAAAAAADVPPGVCVCVCVCVRVCARMCVEPKKRIYMRLSKILHSSPSFVRISHQQTPNHRN